MTQLSKTCYNNCNSEHCNKYCEMLVGKALMQFVCSLDTVKSNIGEMRHSETASSDKGYKVTGLQLDYGDVKSDLLSPISVSLETVQKFKEFMGVPAIRLLKMYLDTLDSANQEDVRNVIARYNSISFNTLLVRPFNNGTEFYISYTEDSGKVKTIVAKLSSTIWCTDRNTGRLYGKFVFKLDEAGYHGKIFKALFEDYGKLIKVKSYSNAAEKESSKDLIRMTRHGIVKPIVIKAKDHSIATDGRSIYRIKDGKITVLSNVENSKFIPIDGSAEGLKSKAYDILKKNWASIELHKKLIAPFGTFEENTIEV